MKAEKQNMPELLHEIDRLLIEEFRDPDVREIYCEEFLNAKIATQIKVLREQREWTQEELAEHAEMKQERVAVLENVNYESWTLNVLRRFAKAYDLAIDVEFKEFGEFLREFDIFGRERLEKRSFKDDPVFKKATNVRAFPERVARPGTATSDVIQIRLPFDTESMVHLQPIINAKAKEIEEIIKREAAAVSDPTLEKRQATAAGT